MKLNLGAGAQELAGYENWDRKNGHEAYPLEVPDNSVEEIRASHVLEHFSHRQTSEVVNHWVQKLEPGGRLKIAVPDFLWIAKNFVDGQPINVLGYTMGGHTDEDDRHGAIFDDESLMEVMICAGLERIGRWESELEDCARLPVSLNLQGFRPNGSARRVTQTAAILSAPRFGPLLHMRVAFNALAALGIPYQIGQGAYWHQVLCEMLEEALVRGDKYVLTLDYDSVFRAEDVLELYRLMEAASDVDALCPVQSRRCGEHALFGVKGKDGKPRATMPAIDFDRHLTKVFTGHFGCTMIRVASLEKLPRPWMMPAPSPAGRWDNDRRDADISFWVHWEKAGLSLYLANRVIIGHQQEMISWPGKDFKPVLQTAGDYEESGIPASVPR